MKSLKELYKIGRGPSSSHTMGPRKAAEIFASKNNQAGSFEVTLYGSLAATGKGHLTDAAIVEVLKGIAPVTILWEPSVFLPYHPNGMLFRAFAESTEISSKDRQRARTAERSYSEREPEISEETLTGLPDPFGRTIIDEWVVYSTGGGALSDGKEAEPTDEREVYALNDIEDIMKWCDKTGKSYWEYVDLCEDPDIWDYLREVWRAMKASVEAGIETEGSLPGPLGLSRKAPTYYIKACGYKASLQSRGLVYAYALAVSEENASGGTIVTAPTCGSSGVLPGALYHVYTEYNFSESRILHAIATGGLFGNVAKTNASISGAEVGCQGEVGVACAMTAAATNQLFGGSLSQIEYAAEMGLEHHLGMTCDPVCGLVQIPCIERNAYAAARALDSNLYAAFSDGGHRVSYDRVVRVMKQTGHDIPSLYKETAEGGLAKHFKQRRFKLF